MYLTFLMDDLAGRKIENILRGKRKKKEGGKERRKDERKKKKV